MTYIPKTNFQFTNPADPAGTTSTAGVMMGLAGSLTPKGMAAVECTLVGSWRNDTNAKGLFANIRYGTGAPPSNGAAATGTAVSIFAKFLTVEPAAGYLFPFAVVGMASALTVGTTYWFDAQVGVYFSAGGTAEILDLNFTLIEL